MPGMSIMPNKKAVIGPKWTGRFLDLADLVATWSKDPSTQCGAVVVDKRRRVLGLGYNGFPDRISDNPAWLADRETKYAMVIHAEMNAILNAKGSVRNASLFVTGPPCSDCAKFVVQSGICEVHYRLPEAGKQGDFAERWAENLKKSEAIFARADVPLIGSL